MTKQHFHFLPNYLPLIIFCFQVLFTQTQSFYNSYPLACKKSLIIIHTINDLTFIKLFFCQKFKIKACILKNLQKALILYVEFYIFYKFIYLIVSTLYKDQC